MGGWAGGLGGVQCGVCAVVVWSWSSSIVDGRWPIIINVITRSVIDHAPSTIIGHRSLIIYIHQSNMIGERS